MIFRTIRHGCLGRLGIGNSCVRQFENSREAVRGPVVLRQALAVLRHTRPRSHRAPEAGTIRVLLATAKPAALMRHVHRRGTAGDCRRSLVMGRAIRNHLKEGTMHIRGRIGLAIAVSAKTFQVPGPPVLQTLFDAVFGAHDRTGQHRRRLSGPNEKNRSVDATFAMTHHARHQSRR
jgi:hypothetical protein